MCDAYGFIFATYFRAPFLESALLFNPLKTLRGAQTSVEAASGAGTRAVRGVSKHVRAVRPVLTRIPVV